MPYALKAQVIANFREGMMKPVQIKSGIAAALFSVSLSACAGVDIEQIHSPGSDFELVNGGIRIGGNSVVGDLETVNGSIKLGSQSQADDIEVVNGSITLGDDVTVSSIESVNGGITAGDRLQVEEGIDSVNGHIRLGEGAVLGEGIETVNGKISFSGARIGGDIETVNSNLDTGANSVILGDIVYGEASRGNHTPVVVIGPGTRVEGELRFERLVDLRVHETATIGRVIRLKDAAGSERL